MITEWKEITSAKIINCGVYDNSTSVSISNYYNGDLSKLTTNNFILGLNNASGWIQHGRTGGSGATSTIYGNISYSNGIVTIQALNKLTDGADGKDSAGVKATVTLYLVI